MQRLLNFFGFKYRYMCLCGWFGNVVSWTDTTDEARSHVPICPRCFRRVK